MSGPLLSSSSEATSSPSNSPVSTGSSTPSISGRLSPLPESDEGEAGLVGGCPLPIRTLAESNKVILDLELGAKADRAAVDRVVADKSDAYRFEADRPEEDLGHTMDFNDIMLIFGTGEVGAEEVRGSFDWMSAEAFNKDKGD